MKITEIIQGTLNKVVGVNKDLMIFRTDYGCKRCAIGYDAEGNYTGWCRRPEGGCGCKTDSKASLIKARCPNGVWQNRKLSQNALIQINEERNFISRNPIQPDVILELNGNNSVIANIIEK